MNRILQNNWRLRSRLSGLAILAAVSLSTHDYAAARTGLPTHSQETLSVNFTAHQAAARAHLKLFFENVLSGNGLSNHGAALRVALPTPDGRHTLIWVVDFIKHDGQLSGVAATNEARIVQFNPTQIVDWSLVGAHGRMYGNYSTRLILETISPAQADQIAAILTETPTPKEWFQ